MPHQRIVKFCTNLEKNEEKMSYSTYLQPISRLILQLPESITKCFFSPLTGYFCMYDFVVVIKTKNKTCYYIDTFLARMKSHSWPYNLNIKKSNTKCLFFFLKKIAGLKYYIYILSTQQCTTTYNKYLHQKSLLHHISSSLGDKNPQTDYGEHHYDSSTVTW